MLPYTKINTYKGFNFETISFVHARARARTHTHTHTHTGNEAINVVI